MKTATDKNETEFEKLKRNSLEWIEEQNMKGRFVPEFIQTIIESQQTPQSKESGEKTNFVQIRDLTDEEWMKRPKEEILQLLKNCYKLLIDQVGLKEKSQQAGQNDVKKGDERTIDEYLNSKVK